MLEIKYVRRNLSKIRQMLKNRNDSADLQAFELADEKQREILAALERLRHERNVVSDEIAAMKKNGVNAEDRIRQMREVSAEIKSLEGKIAKFDEKTKDILIRLPNMPHKSVPAGDNENDNPVIYEKGIPAKFDFTPAAHWTLGKNLGIIDFERAAKITGARFALYMGAGALLERALINFMLQTHTTEHGYTEVLPPFMVNRNTMTNTGQLPKFEEDLFKIENRDYYLIPTAEVPVTNIHQQEILDESALPVKYVAYTPCFRSEAGSYGKDTRGLIRQHQFNKVELVKFSHPDKSYDELQALLADAESILQKLDLPYRVILLCTGDLGFSAAKTYDIEVWMPAQGKYREISSCSNFESFQARRAGIRFKGKGMKKTEFVHTLNGSGLAVGRTVAAILENCQQPDGSVLIPEALRPFMGGMERITN